MSVDETIAGAATRARAAPSRGGLVGRYVVLDRLGAGGMGVVYAAYDPELDRKVAVKLLHPSGSGSAAASEGRARLLREAQALARLSHPNVVAVHDVGTFGEQVYVAMEFVQGRTLTAWLAEEPRNWKVVLATMRAAAEGLVAAHAAGLVHRDLKPDNLMVGADGRVRVMDFGLARAGVEGVVVPQDVEPARPSVLDAELTTTGAVLGTPAYMAPEQHLGLPTDPRSDQFSFCVTAWEALYGERPFTGKTLAELSLAVSEGRHRAPPSGRRVPSWLRRLLERGLAAEPNDRHASMSVLAHELGRGQARWRTRALLAGAGLLGIAVTGGVGWREWEQRERVAACEHAGSQIREEWNESAREAVRAAITATRHPIAEATAEKIVPWLDARADEWELHRTRACLSAEVDGTLRAEELEKALWCLDDARLEFSALVAELSQPEEKTALRAVTAAARLSPAASCTDPATMNALPLPPVSADHDEVMQVRRGLSRARARLLAADYVGGLDVVRRAVAQAEAIGWPPLVARGRHVEGELLDRAGSYREAEAALAAAYFEAARTSAWAVASDAATVLVFNIGWTQARPDDARLWAEHGAVAADYAADPLGLREASRLHNFAAVQHARGEYAEAKALFERVLDLREGVLGSDHPDVAVSLNNLGLVHASIGSHAEAVDFHTRALRIQEAALGPDHPDVAVTLTNLANEHFDAGRHAEAIRAHERALRIRESVLGPDHWDVAQTLNNLGIVCHATGDNARARSLHERALAIQERSLGPNHPEVAASVVNLANLSVAEGKYAGAREMYGRALALDEETFGPDHPNVALTLNNLALVDLRMNDHASADARYRRALAIREKAFGLEHPSVAYSLVGLSRVALADGRPSDAVPLAARALTLREKAGAQPRLIAEARFLLGRALWESAQDRDRARALVAQARDGFREAGSGSEEDLDETVEWLAKHVGVQ
jgi:tetratricopeptide (TPR) repeat protein